MTILTFASRMGALAVTFVPAVSLAQAYVPRPPDTSTTAVVSTIPITFARPQPNPYHTLGTNETLYPLFRGYAFGDLDGDGKPEFVVCPYYYNFQPQLPIVVLRNLGDGRFADGTSTLIEGAVPTCGSPNGIYIRDFTGDGRNDILVIDQGLEDKNPNNPGMDGGVNRLLASQANGRLRDVTATAFPGQVNNFNHVSSIGDMDGNGTIDIVLTRLGGPRLPAAGLTLLLNNGSGVFTDRSERLPEGVAQPATFRSDVDQQGPGGSGAGDLDGDGRLDIVSASYNGPDRLSRKRTVRMLQQQGDGRFVERYRTEIPAAIAQIPSFQGRTVASDGSGGLGASGVSIADFNGDGRNDVLVTWEGGGGTSYFQFLRNDGNFTFTDMTQAWWGGYASFVAVDGFNAASMLAEPRDLNGDGIPDLVIRRGYINQAAITPSVNWFLNDGTGRFTPWTWRSNGAALTAQQVSTSFFCNACGTLNLMMADVDGDGVEDAVNFRYLSNFNATPQTTSGFEMRTFRSTIPAAPGTSVKDLWWAGTAENGWGMSITQHRDTLFAVLYVYDAQGNPVWYVMPGGTWNAAHTAYSGSLYFPRGAPFSAYNASQFVVGAPIGTATLTFNGNSNATVAYTINGVSSSKAIQRQAFAAGASLVRYDDIWWAGVGENGWGINISQQADVLFAVWYTYDAAGVARWYVLPGGSWSHNRFSGTLYTTRSSPWLGVPYLASSFAVSGVGTLSLTFLNENSASMSYSVNGVQQTKSIVRQPF